jgi:dipeptidase
MTRGNAAVAAVLGLAVAMTVQTGHTCTNLLVTKGASADGSVIVTYTCDGRFHPHLRAQPAADHEPGEVVEIRTWGGELRGTIPQVARTHAVVGLMNEHQLVIAETTTTGREELVNPEGLLGYWDLMRLALERARTAREAIEVMTSLVAEHGYRSTAEAFSIADPDEVWLMEMIGPGPGGDGAIWAALKVPDGTISAHANASRIGELVFDDPERCRYSDNVVSFAVQRGYFDPDAGEPFRFSAAYDVDTPQSRRYTATRVWSLFRRAAPSLDLDPGYHRFEDGAEPYPLWITPDHKLSVADVMALMRDHYEGTAYDMTRGLDAGPFGSPNRWRPMTWEVDGRHYSWERPISTQQTGFSFISQSRGWLPDPVGGLLWYGVDDTFTTCWFPLYCSIDEVPPSFAAGSLGAFSWDSAFWVFNFVANLANLKYSYMIEDIRLVQRELEGHMLALQPAVEATAVALHERDPDLMRRYLTDYSVGHAEDGVRRWRALGEHLLTRYNDGYVAGEPGEPVEVGYPSSWLEEVLRAEPDRFRLRQPEEMDTELPY